MKNKVLDALLIAVVCIVFSIPILLVFGYLALKNRTAQKTGSVLGGDEL